MGESAGGQITAVVAQRARDDLFFRAHPLTGQIPSIPTVCHPGYYPEKYALCWTGRRQPIDQTRCSDTKIVCCRWNRTRMPRSYRRNRCLLSTVSLVAISLRLALLILLIDWLGGDPKDPSISPLLAPSFGGLPKTFIQVAGLDPLRDEAILYGDLLREAGVETKVEMYVTACSCLCRILKRYRLATRGCPMPLKIVHPKLGLRRDIGRICRMRLCR
jgi:acetyl esterase/lipase